MSKNEKFINQIRYWNILVLNTVQNFKLQNGIIILFTHNDHILKKTGEHSHFVIECELVL